MLYAKIGEATIILNKTVVGKQAGMVAQIDKDALSKSIRDAQTIYDDWAKQSQAKLDAATIALEEAITTFNNSIIVALPGLSDVILSKNATSSSNVVNLGNGETLVVDSADNQIATVQITGSLNNTISITSVEVGNTTVIVNVLKDGKIIKTGVISITTMQDEPDLFFSEYIQAGDGRIAIELYYKGDGLVDGKSYNLEIHKYMKKTDTVTVSNQPFISFYKGMTYIIISRVFYDFFDITPATYFNDEIDIYDPTNYNTVALVLKKDGQVIDIIGDVNSKQPIFLSGVTIIRKDSIYGGSTKFNIKEWNEYPENYFTNIGKHSVN